VYIVCTYSSFLSDFTARARTSRKSLMISAMDCSLAMLLKFGNSSAGKLGAGVRSTSI